MADITTVSVHPERADELRDYRDENDFSSMDDAIAALMDSRGGE